MAYLPLWKIWVRQLGWWHSQCMESHKIHFPNHQPDKHHSWSSKKQKIRSTWHAENFEDNTGWEIYPDHPWQNNIDWIRMGPQFDSVQLGHITPIWFLLVIYRTSFHEVYKPIKKNTLLRVIPTMTFIHFVTDKSSGILSDIGSVILSGIPSGILSGILPGISSGILSGISSGILFGKSCGILSGKHSGTLSAIPSGIPSGILSGISSGILSGISSGILSDILSGHWAGQVPGWGPAVHTELGSSKVEVQRCTLSWAAPRLRSSSAHWAGQLAGWGPAVHTELGSWQRAWRRELAKRVGKRAWRRVGKAEVQVEVDADMVEEKLEEEARRRTRRKRTASRGGGGGGRGGGRGRGGRALW